MDELDIFSADLSKLTIPQLKKLCSKHGIQKYSKLNKTALLALVTDWKNSHASKLAPSSCAPMDASSDRANATLAASDAIQAELRSGIPVSPAHERIVQDAVSSHAPNVHIPFTKAILSDKASESVISIPVQQRKDLNPRPKKKLKTSPTVAIASSAFTAPIFHPIKTPNDRLLPMASNASKFSQTPLFVRDPAPMIGVEMQRVVRRFIPLKLRPKETPTSKAKASSQFIPPKILWNEMPAPPPPLSMITMPPKLKQRKQVDAFAVILMGLSDSERRVCVQSGSRLLRYAGPSQTSWLF